MLTIIRGTAVFTRSFFILFALLPAKAPCSSLTHHSMNYSEKDSSHNTAPKHSLGPPLSDPESVGPALCRVVPVRAVVPPCSVGACSSGPGVSLVPSVTQHAARSRSIPSHSMGAPVITRRIRNKIELMTSTPTCHPENHTQHLPAVFRSAPGGLVLYCRTLHKPTQHNAQFAITCIAPYCSHGEAVSSPHAQLAAPPDRRANSPYTARVCFAACA